MDDPDTVDRLVPLIDEESRVLAHRQLARERRHLTPRTTALVHEAYLKLAGDPHVAGRGRAYFFAAAAQAMRQSGGPRAPARGREARRRHDADARFR